MPVAAIGGIGLIAGAIVALLFLLAYGSMRDSIHQNLTYNVGVGPFTVDLLGWAVDAADFVYEALLAVLDGLTVPLANAIIAPVAAIESLFDQALQAVSQTAGAVANLYWGVIPELANAIESATGFNLLAVYSDVDQISAGFLNVAQTLQTDLGARIAGVVSQEFADVTHLQNEIDSLTVGATLDVTDVTDIATHAAQAVVSSSAATLGAAISTAFDDAEAFTRQNVSALLGDIAAAVTTAEQFTTTAVEAVAGISITDIDTAITTGLTAIWPDISAVIPELEGVIGTGDADILDALGRIDWTIPANLTGVASLLGVTSLTLARYLKDCGIPNCQNLSQFGRDLQDLLAIANSASFLGFIVELIRDPGDAAATLDNAFGDIIGTGIADVRSLIGI